MKQVAKNEIVNVLLKISEEICQIVGKLITQLTKQFPVIKKYFIAFLKGAQELVILAYEEIKNNETV